jgi:outer membrane protein assembly factor BamE (lipoprotein component of BamABCDE complex)
MKTRLFASALFLVVALLAGCATAEKLNLIQIGMTKGQVVAILGQPDSTSAQSNIEYYTYYLTNDSARYGNQPYMVRLVGGQVESFGRFMQLFDIYNRPINGTQPTFAGFNAPTVVPSPANPSLATELQRIKVLKDQGALTEEEFQQAKVKLLDAK